MLKKDGSATAFEIILTRTRPFGPFQRRLFALTTLLQGLVVTVVLFLDFLELSPQLKNGCDVHVAGFNDSLINGTNSKNETCEVDYEGRPWILPEWYYAENGRRQFNIVWLSQGCGIVGGAIVGGFMGDFLGRKVAMFLSLALVSMFQGAVSVFDAWHLFLVFRTLVGVSSGGFIVNSSVMVIEHMGHDWRDVCTCCCLWSFGVGLLSLEAFVTRHWRYLAIATSITTLLSTGTYFLFPESFRWYNIRERFADSESGIKEIASQNHTSYSNLIVLCDKAKTSVLNSMHKRTHTYTDLIQSKSWIKVTAVVIFVWMVTCTVYRCLLERIARASSNTVADICLYYGIDIPLVYTAIIINKCIGRRWCLFLYATSSGFALFCILVTHIINDLDSDDAMITGVSVFGKLGVTATLALLHLVTLELYPTCIRCMGLAVGVSAGVVGLGVGRYLHFEYAQQYHFTLPFVCYGGMMAVVGFASLLLPETWRKPLPDLLPSRHRMISMQEVTRLVHAWDTR